MKEPARLFVDELEVQSNEGIKQFLGEGVFAAWEYPMKATDTEYIRRDVVIEWATEIVDIALSNIFISRETLEELLDNKIANADKD